jgi:hypothetical protein
MAATLTAGTPHVPASAAASVDLITALSARDAPTGIGRRHRR